MLCLSRSIIATTRFGRLTVWASAPWFPLTSPPVPNIPSNPTLTIAANKLVTFALAPLLSEGDPASIRVFVRNASYTETQRHAIPFGNLLLWGRATACDLTLHAVPQRRSPPCARTKVTDDEGRSAGSPKLMPTSHLELVPICEQWKFQPAVLAELYLQEDQKDGPLWSDKTPPNHERKVNPTQGRRAGRGALSRIRARAKTGAMSLTLLLLQKCHLRPLRPNGRAASANL